MSIVSGGVGVAGDQQAKVVIGSMEAAAAGSLGRPAGWNSAWRRKTNFFFAMTMLLTLYFIGGGVAFLICTRTFASFSPNSQAPVELFPGLNCSGFEKPAGLMQQQAVLEELQVPPHALPDRVVVEANVTANMITNATTLQADDDGQSEFTQNPVISWDKRAQAASFSPESQAPVELFPGPNSSDFEKPAELTQQQAVLEELQVPPHALPDRVVVEANVTANMITNATTVQADDDGQSEFTQNPVISWDKRAQAASFSPESQAPVELFPGPNSSGFEKPAELTQQQAVLEELQVPPHALADPVVVEDNVTANMITNATTVQADDDGEPEFMQDPVINWDKRAKAAELNRRLKLMSSAERGRWVQENWSSFKILKEDNVSEQFDNRMREFLCNSNSTAHPAAVGNSLSANATSSLRHKIDEAHLCAPNPSSFCTERFFLTWMSHVAFSPRERLGLESIFKHHPSACVVILSRVMDSDAGRAILALFLARGYRVTAVTPDVKSLFSGTPAAKWLSRLRDGTGDPGCVNLMQNLSNLMRLATIYKYGGVYLDTDVIVVKSFSPLRNAVGAQSEDTEGHWTDLNNAVIIFEREHPFVLELLQEFQATFNGSRWGWNGPSLFSRVAHKVLQVQKWRNCSDVALLPRQAFYPIIWEDIIKFYHKPTEDHENKTLQMTDASRITNGTYSVHLWNSMSNHLRVQPGSDMEALCKRSCLFCK